MEQSYYGVHRTEEYLAHYGIRGMKWGVRKAKEKGNERKLTKQYEKAQKKLAKLESRAKNGNKYVKRAVKLGTGAAVAGGLAIGGTGAVSNAISKGGRAVGRSASVLGTKMMASKNATIRKAGNAVRKVGMNTINSYPAINNAAKAVTNWGKSTSVRDKTVKNIARLGNSYVIGPNGNMVGNSTLNKVAKVADSARHRNTPIYQKMTNNNIARAGAAAVGLGLGAGAAYNAYRAKTTGKAAKKAAQFRSEMNKAFAGTQYASKPRQGKKRRRT